MTMQETTKQIKNALEPRAKPSYAPSFKIENSADKATMYIYDFIGKDWWDDSGFDDKDVINELKKANGKPIDVRINSDGGNVYEGIAIYNALKRYENQVDIYVDGIAASIASVITCAGDNVFISNGAAFMIHDPSIVARGSKEEMQKAINALDAAKDSILDIYVEKTGIDRAELSDLMTKETWFTSNQAVDRGFATKEVESTEPIQNKLNDSLSGLRQRQPENTHIQAVYNRLFHAKNLVNGEGQKDDEEVTITNSLKDDVNNASNTEILNKAKKEARDLEAKRRTDIKALFDGVADQDDLREQCLDDFDCDVTAAQTKLLTALKAAPVAKQSEQKPVGASGGATVTNRNIEGIKAAWKARAENKYDAANEMRNVGLLDAMRIDLENHGVRTAGMSRDDLVDRTIKNSRMGMSDFPILMGDFSYRSVLSGYELQSVTWRGFCSTGSFIDFREQELHSVGVMGVLEEKGADGNYVEGILPDTEIQKYAAKERGRLFTISRKTLINDDLSVIRDLLADYGGATSRTIEKAVYTYMISNPVLKDGHRLFSAEHKNLIAAGPMTEEIWKEVLIKMASQTAVGSKDDFLAIEPEILVTSIQDWFIANELNTRETGAEAKPTIGWFQQENLIKTQRMAGVGSIYLGSPISAPVFRVGFLNGQQSPQVRVEDDFNSADFRMRIMADFGVGVMNPRGAVFHPKA